MGKQVKTPRFYVDIPTFLHATGQLGWDANKGGAELLYMNCANPFIVNIQNTQSVTPFAIGGQGNIKTSFPINFVALLNHNLASNSKKYKVVGKVNNIGQDLIPTNEILNSDYESALIKPKYNGTSIFSFSDENGDNNSWESFELFYNSSNPIDVGTHQLGSFVVGKYFDCPNSPDLNVTMSRRFDGIKKQKTIGGKQLANIYYDGPTEWTMNNSDGTTYKYPPFELDTTSDEFNQRVKSGLGRKGLRSWNLTFSYISESDMWIDNEISNNVKSSEEEPSDNTPSPMLSDNSFNFVYNCTLGGALPFIFTDDKDSNAPDRYSICTFRENSFKVTQIAFNTYNVSMTIDEIA